MRVPFLDLVPQYLQIKKDMFAAFKATMQRGDFILGKEVIEFEKAFASFNRRKFCVGINSGTDALFLGLLSLGIGPGDEVIVPAFTYIATSLAVTYTGAKPVFVDIDEKTYNIDVNKIEGALTKRTKAVIPVHLYGQPADMNPIIRLARKYKLKVIEDTAQAHGAKYKAAKNKWQVAGSFGDIGCFSFYPTKNLGAFGDGGAIATDNKEVYKKMLMLRDYGRRSRYEHVSIGYNSRLDTLQAAVLKLKLKHLEEWNQMRRNNAERYTELLKGIGEVITPFEADYSHHVYHIYAVRVKNRDRVIEELKRKGVGVLIHYPIPIHLQKVYATLGYKKRDFPIAKKISDEIISLPMYPHLEVKKLEYVASALKESVVK